MSRISIVRCTVLTGIVMVLQCPCPAAQTPAGAKSKPAAKPAPQVKAKPSGKLTLSPSTDYGGRLYKSWPLVLKVALWRELPTGKDVPKPLTIKVKQGTWSDALVVQVKNSSGMPVKWPFHPVKQKGASLTLGIDDTAQAEWWMAPEDTQAIPEGDYVVSISFDSKLLVDPPVIASDNYCLHVLKEPSPLDAEMKLDKQLELARLAMVKGDMAGASAIVDKVLTADPENIGGNRMKAALLNREGKTVEAVGAINRALTSYYKKYPDACPPAGLLSEHSGIMSKIKPKKTAE